MRKIFSLAIVSMLLSCATVRNYPDIDGADARQMMESTVKVFVTVHGNVAQRNLKGNVIFVPETMNWTGSGVVLKNDYRMDESLVMTASHVSSADMPIPLITGTGFALFIPEEVEITVAKMDGTKCAAKELVADHDNDLGMLEVDCIAGREAKLASRLPPLGAIVSTSGAALGYHPPNSFIVTDGRYVGLTSDKEPFVTVTLPGAPGHSGSGLFYRGKVFGILVRGSSRFHHMIYGTELSNLHRLYNVSLELWNNGSR